MFYLNASLGLMFLLKYGSILQPIRSALIIKIPRFEEFFKCSLCIGFWTGVMVSFFLPSYEYDVIESALFPLVSCAWCWSIDIVLDYIAALTSQASSSSGVDSSNKDE